MSSLRALVRSFRFAILGLWFTLCHERNMRIHLVAALYVLWAAPFFALTKTQYCVLLLLFGLVMACEAINTSIEKLTNLQSPAYNSLARIAKDAAAGAVLVAAVFAVGIGVLLFSSVDGWRALVGALMGDWWRLGLFLVGVVLAALFVFVGPLRIRSFFQKGRDKRRR